MVYIHVQIFKTDKIHVHLLIFKTTLIFIHINKIKISETCFIIDFLSIYPPYILAGCHQLKFAGDNELLLVTAPLSVAIALSKYMCMMYKSTLFIFQFYLV